MIRHPEDLGEDDVPTFSDLRLFSSGGGRELLEWDLERSCIRVCFSVLFRQVSFNIFLSKENYQLSRRVHMVHCPQPIIFLPRTRV